MTYKIIQRYVFFNFISNAITEAYRLRGVFETTDYSKLVD